MNKDDIRTSIDLASRELGWGGKYTAIAESLFGLNHRGTGNFIPNNQDGGGLTLFVRPCCNLSYDNIAGRRVLSTIANAPEQTLQRVVRCYLDHRGEIYRTPAVTCPFVDPKQAFIPLLTNSLTSISGWPDLEAPTYSSTPDKFNGSFSFVDGVLNINRDFDLTATFKNVQGDPISLLFTAWVHYASDVYMGRIWPYPDKYVLNLEIDYQTRIYRLILDPTKRFVQKIGATGIAFPTTAPLGAAFNYTSDQVMQQENDQLSIRFRCQGAIYMDPVLIDDFNRTVVMFNQGMADGVRESLYHKLSNNELNFANNMGYARINPDTYELEWWLDEVTYNKFVQLGAF